MSTLWVENNQNVCVGDLRVFSAEKIIEAKFFDKNLRVAILFTITDEISVAFLTLRPVPKIEKSFILYPEPKKDRRIVLEVSQAGAPFLHYYVAKGRLFIITTDKKIGPLDPEKAENLLQKMRLAQ